MPDETRDPTEEEVRAALDEQMRTISVDDVILQTVATLVNLSARRLGLAAAPGEDPGEDFDLEQARTGIEAVRALLPLTPPDQLEAVRQALSQLQMTFAQEAQARGFSVARAGEGSASVGADPAQPGPGEAARPQGAPPDDAGEAERARARSKIWTPPGT